MRSTTDLVNLQVRLNVLFNPDFPLALVAKLIKRLKMREKKKKLCGRRSHSTLTNNF